MRWMGSLLPLLLLVLPVLAQPEPKPEAARAVIDANNKAIERGCLYLESVQNSNGAFPPAWGAAEYEVGTQALCLLALLHGGRDAEADHVRQGLSMLDKMLGRESKKDVYSAAIVLMLYQKLYEPEQWSAGLFSAPAGKQFEDARKLVWKEISAGDRKTIDRMVNRLNDAAVDNDRGGWGYTALSRKDAQAATAHSDNSCSQFAMLGYKSASLLGAKLDAEVFLKEARRLTSQYVEQRAARELEFRFDPLGQIGVGVEADAAFKGTIRPGGWGYGSDPQWSLRPQWAAAGLGSLAICLDELKARELISAKSELALAQRIGLVMRGAHAQLTMTFLHPRAPDPTRSPGELTDCAGDGVGLYYKFYAMARGCLLADTAKLGTQVDWYAAGAAHLVKTQGEDGSWPLPHGVVGLDKKADTRVIDTSMAVLFLRQAAPPIVTEHVRRDRERMQRLADTAPAKPITPASGEGKK